MDDLADRTATELQVELQSGRLTARALVDACLWRIEERDGNVAAWAFLDPAHARAQADALDTAFKESGPVGPLHGLPVGIKDIIDTADMPTQNGSDHFVGHQPERDATCVAQLRAAGAVIMGKTVTTELANMHPGKTRNPHNANHTPGGSSSGSAAAVACGMVPLALGTQTGGSVVRPASFCGIHGLKPTLGLISRTGVTLQSHTLDTVGVYGRSLDDIALLVGALDQHDATDDVSYARAGTDYDTVPFQDAKLAAFKTPAWGEADDDTKQAFERFVASLAVSEPNLNIAPKFDEICELHKVVQASENVHYYDPLVEKDASKVSDTLKARLETGRTTSVKQYLRAITQRAALHALIDAELTRYDALVCLSSAGPAPAGLETTGNPIFNGLWTYLGLPTVTLPALNVRGLPCGITLVGRRRGEARLLRVAAAVEQQLQAA